MKKILMINNLSSTFIQKDYEILNKNYNLTKIEPKLKNVFKMFKSSKKCDVIYAWWLNSRYAGWLGLLTNKPVVYVAGGFDTVKNKEIGYGVFQNPIYNIITRFNIKSAEKILVVSKNLKYNLIKNVDDIDESKIQVIPTGYDFDFWKNTEDYRFIKNICVVVNQYTNIKKFKTRCLVKGIDRFIDHVYKTKERSIIVGVNQDMLVKLYPEVKGLILNKTLEVLPLLNRGDLKLLFNSSENYCLFSRHEGLPNVLIEAMLCGCKSMLSFEMNYLKDINPRDYKLEFRENKLNEVFKNIK
ncbi:glycosyltransferase, partial [bacterium]|nr:glycosyltransferase [bacterium]